MVTLHVGGVSEEADERMLTLKFGVFGSIGSVKFLRDKNIGEFNFAINKFGHLASQ
jgi:hypothetical protein